MTYKDRARFYTARGTKLISITRVGHITTFQFSDGYQFGTSGRDALKALKEFKPLITPETVQTAKW